RYLYRKDMLEGIGDHPGLPDWLGEWAQFICGRQWMSTLAQQATVQRYGPDSLLGPHIDSPKCFGPSFVTFSLVSPAQFRLTNQKARQRLSITVEPGDVAVLQREARSIWKHEVLKHKAGRRPREEDATWSRLSVTFRTIAMDRIQA